MKKTAVTRLGWITGRWGQSVKMVQSQLPGKQQKKPILDRDTASHIADLAAKGSTVAIAADDDPMYDFYLLKFTSEGVEELESDYIDDYQCTALRDEEFIKGNFYLRNNIHNVTFTLDVKRTTVVYAATVRHICGELPAKKKGRKNHLHASSKGK